MKHILVTGGAGFIGSSLCDKLLENDQVKVTCIDNFDTFYPESFKKRSLSALDRNPRFKFVEQDISELGDLDVWLPDNYDVIVHLAAEVGSRSSVDFPIHYQQTNVIGTQNLLDFAKMRGVKQFVFASSGNAYGLNANLPWAEESELLPISTFTATKAAGELLGRVYYQLHGIRFIALRLFTVYGPRQRPDMVIHKFTRDIIQGDAITVYGDGTSLRDYVYIDDALSALMAAIDYESSGFEIFNIASGKTVELQKVIQTLELAIGEKATINRLPDQTGDVRISQANIEKAKKLLDYTPQTEFDEGVAKFVRWFRDNEDWLLL